jgi:SAM-dependent methyltransferase
VIGVDTSPAMLDRAREKVPGGPFYEADLHDLPLADDSVDLVVCALALSSPWTEKRGAPGGSHEGSPTLTGRV